jgi:hypothetical protein
LEESRTHQSRWSIMSWPREDTMAYLGQLWAGAAASAALHRTKQKQACVTKTKNGGVWYVSRSPPVFEHGAEAKPLGRWHNSVVGALFSHNSE